MSHVVHCKKNRYDVYIGRPSKWGNPFVVGKDGTREEIVEKYHQWILTQSKLLRDLWELKGKNPGCWCSLLACHGDVLCKLVEKLECSCGGRYCVRNKDFLFSHTLYCIKCGNSQIDDRDWSIV